MVGFAGGCVSGFSGVWWCFRGFGGVSGGFSGVWRSFWGTFGWFSGWCLVLRVAFAVSLVVWILYFVGTVGIHVNFVFCFCWRVDIIELVEVVWLG